MWSSVFQDHVDVLPGAKERIEARLKDLPEINKNRPCKKCIHYRENCIISCGLNGCNFHHSGFKSIYKMRAK